MNLNHLRRLDLCAAALKPDRCDTCRDWHLSLTWQRMTLDGPYVERRDHPEHCPTCQRPIRHLLIGERLDGPQ
jgi:hypothetical protein